MVGQSKPTGAAAAAEHNGLRTRLDGRGITRPSAPRILGLLADMSSHIQRGADLSSITYVVDHCRLRPATTESALQLEGAVAFGAMATCTIGAVMYNAEGPHPS